VPPDADGIVSPAAIARALRPDTVLCSLLWAHNELGTIQPIEAVGALCREHGALLHSDATQAVPRIPIATQHVDLLSLSAHKMYGPKGVGALFVRRRPNKVRLSPLLVGGEQQEGLRSGTLPVPLIVGFGAAAALVAAERESEAERLRRLAQRLWTRLSREAQPLLLNGHGELRLPGSLNVSFLGAEAQAMLLELPGLALSPGSACSAEKQEPSDALLAIGRSMEAAFCSLRIGLGRFNTEAEVDQVAEALIRTATRLRARMHRPSGSGEAA
jgi:cysteine desulfurase